MNRVISSSSFQNLYKETIKTLIESPDFVCSPRGMKVNELLFATLVLENPRNRIVVSPAREPNYGFGVGEFLWYVTGKQDLDTMLYYNKRMKKFSDDGKTLNSAYGHRMFSYVKNENGIDTWTTQWEAALKKLSNDRDTRQAVIHINQPHDQVKLTRDVPCTLSIMFFIRENKLFMRNQMRSNDIIWGTLYDIYSFTLFHELMLNDLKKVYPELELGPYVHQADSLHLYEQHFEMANKIVAEPFHDVEPQKPIINSELQGLLLIEESLRTGRLLFDQISVGETVNWMSEQLEEQAKKRNAEKNEK